MMLYLIRKVFGKIPIPYLRTGEIRFHKRRGVENCEGKNPPLDSSKSTVMLDVQMIRVEAAGDALAVEIRIGNNREENK